MKTLPGERIPPWAIGGAAGAFGLFAFLAWGLMTLSLKVRDGSIKVEIDQSVLDAGVTAALDGDELRLTALGETIQASLGDHTLTVRRGDLVVETRNFAIVRGEVPVIRITLVDEPADKAPTTPLPKEPPPPVAASQPAPAVRKSPQPPAPALVTRSDPATAKAVPADPDRHAAEWILEVGGRIIITDGGPARHVKALDELPQGEFQVHTAYLDPYPKFSDEDCEQLQGLLALRHLAVSGTAMTGSGFRFLSASTLLRRIDADNVRLNDAAAVLLAQFQGLEDLHVADAAGKGGLTAAGLKSIGQLRELRALTLAGHPLTDAGLAHLSELQKLEYFWASDTRLANPGFTDAGLKHLSGLKKLGRLDIGNTALTDAGLQHLAEMTVLTSLNLEWTKITGKGFSGLEKLQKLEGLRLTNCPVDDEGIKGLGHLTGLTSLALNGTPVTDTGIQQLKTLANLQQLHLQGTQVTPDGIEKLKQRIPKCNIHGP